MMDNGGSWCLDVCLEPKLHLKLDDKEIEQVSEVKLLGVLIDSRMSWTSQIDEMLK